MYTNCNQSVCIFLFVCYNSNVGEISMTIKGYLFTKAKDKSRLELISNYIWSLNFTKEKPVHIDFNETASEISAKI